MARVGLTPEENLLLLREIEANRAFILLAYQSDPALLKVADPEIRRLFENIPDAAQDTGELRSCEHKGVRDEWHLPP